MYSDIIRFTLMYICLTLINNHKYSIFYKKIFTTKSLRVTFAVLLRHTNNCNPMPSSVSRTYFQFKCYHCVCCKPDCPPSEQCLSLVQLCKQHRFPIQCYPCVRKSDCPPSECLSLLWYYSLLHHIFECLHS